MKITNRKYLCISFGAKTSVIPNLVFISFCVCELIKTCESTCWSSCIKSARKKMFQVLKVCEKKELLKSKGAKKERENCVQGSI